ncbi:hypothetical protein [Streptomyces sp. NPDC018352]|uniref:hypothetical protein n=1 Tax=Streptomyces sp. NPDC018352 TaxID=3157194 RepID=UPI003407BCFE
MLTTQVATPPWTRWTVGIVADGVFKALLAVVCVAGAAPLGRLLGVSGWLMAASGLALLVGGGIEIRYARRRPLRTYLRLMAAYDTGWVLTAVVGLLLARQGNGAGGEVWIGYQTAAPLAFAALLGPARP